MSTHAYSAHSLASQTTYCAEPCCTARPTQRITTRVDGPTYSRRYDDDYCTKHAAEAVAELAGGEISLVVSIVALSPVAAFKRERELT